jgi:hypothetical protein
MCLFRKGRAFNQDSGECDAVFENVDYRRPASVGTRGDWPRLAAARQRRGHGRCFRQRRVGQPVRRERFRELPFAYYRSSCNGVFLLHPCVNLPGVVSCEAFGGRAWRFGSSPGRSLGAGSFGAGCICSWRIRSGGGFAGCSSLATWQRRSEIRLKNLFCALNNERKQVRI